MALLFNSVIHSKCSVTSVALFVSGNKDEITEECLEKVFGVYRRAACFQAA